MGVCVSSNPQAAETPSESEDRGAMQLDTFLGIAPEFQIGDNVGDKYEVASRLEMGKIGLSYVAHGQSVMDMNYVFKCVPFAQQPDSLTHVVQDQKVLIKLQHANVQAVLDVMEDSDGDNMIVVSPYSPEGNVLPLVGMIGKPNFEAEALTRVLREVGSGLRVLHSHQIYHFNLHPRNVMRSKSGSFSVSEAGFHRLFMGRPAVKLFQLKEQGVLAPEMLDDEARETVVPALVDVWAFGVFMYQVAFGQPPFKWGSFEETKSRILTDKVRFPIPEKELPLDFADAVMWALEKKPEHRPSIVKLIRHPFFRSGMGQSFIRFNSGNTLLTQQTTAPGKFTIDRVLGKGPAGETMLIQPPEHAEQNLVLKVLDDRLGPRLNGLGARREEVMRLIAISKKLRHPHVSSIFEVVNTDKDESFVTSMYYGQGDIWLQFPLDEAFESTVTMLGDVVEACHYLNQCGIYHGNLKPSNVFANGGSYAVADFGPVIRFPNAFFRPDGACVYDLPTYIVDKLRQGEGHENVDVFAIGLLAASVNSDVRESIWEKYHKLSSDDLNVTRVVEAINGMVGLPSAYADFVRVALTDPEATLVGLLKHPLFTDLRDSPEEFVPMLLQEKEIKNCIRTRFQHDNAETRLADLIGPEVFLQSPSHANLETNGRAASAVSMESSMTEGENQDLKIEHSELLLCDLCHVKIKMVVFICPERPKDYIRCGKCRNVDTDGNELKAFVVESTRVLDDDNERKMSKLVHPDYLTDHGREEVEMQADIPVGSLATHASMANGLKSQNSTRLISKKSRMGGGSFAMGGFGAPKAEKKLLSEAEANDDLTVEGVIAECHQHQCRDLQLNNFDLTTVPLIVFDPPMTFVTILDLNGNKLQELPHQLSFLSKLEKLVLSSNELRELPESIGDLTELMFLDVSHNQLQDLPPNLMFADKLETIAMDYNDCGEIPGVILDMAAIRTVHLAENHRIKGFPQVHALQGLGNLKLSLDNEPLLWEEYKTIQDQIPRIQMTWNKVYPDPIVENVYCGSLRSAQNLHVYERLNIGYLLTVGRGLEPIVPDGMKHKSVIVDDIPGATIDTSFEEAVDFVEEASQAKSGCLVHCFAGMSRSATTVIAYLMRKRGMRLDDAYLTTKRGRPAIYPNEGFFKQLVKYDEQLFPDQRPLDIASLERDKIPGQ